MIDDDFCIARLGLTLLLPSKADKMLTYAFSLFFKIQVYLSPFSQHKVITKKSNKHVNRTQF